MGTPPIVTTSQGECSDTFLRAVVSTLHKTPSANFQRKTIAVSFSCRNRHHLRMPGQALTATVNDSPAINKFSNAASPSGRRDTMTYASGRVVSTSSPWLESMGVLAH
jgi:hypothetical protein